MAIDKGIFNLQSMFNQFMDYKPDEDDDQGRAIKQTTMADAFNTTLQSELAKGMADYQGGIAKEQMQMQANLERQAAGENIIETLQAEQMAAAEEQASEMAEAAAELDTAPEGDE